MTFRQRLVGLLRNSTSPENPSTPLSAIAKWLSAGNQTVAGESMNEVIALQLISVMAAVRVLAESVASLPCNVYEKSDNGKIVAEGYPLHSILTVAPNDEMSYFTFWETMVGACALAGNSYAEIAWTSVNTVGELYPLNPLMTEPFRFSDGVLGYRTKQGTERNATWRYIKSENILHFKLFSLDGIRGLSPIQQARQSLGLTRAVEKFGARFFGNGSKPGGVLAFKGEEGLNPQEEEQAKNAWEAAHGGSNQGRVAVMAGDWEYTQIGLSPEDSQFLATRNFQRGEIAALFRVPAHMIGDQSKISNSSYEQMNLSFVNDTLRPILTRIEAELNRKLIHTVGRKANKYFCMFDLQQRLRADQDTTMKSVALARQWGLSSVNEGRIALGMNPVSDKDGDSRIVPVNMMSSSLIPDQKTLPNGAPGGGNSSAEEAPAKSKKSSDEDEETGE